MILEKLTLHNFGPYLGRHEFDLSTRSDRRPIILFGGMNGGGKTTILNSLQLVLFGRQSAVWKDDEPSYDAYLRNCVHRKADPEEGAGVELRFRTSTLGAAQTIHLCRYWRATRSGIREDLDVIRDDELDPVLSENWADWVDEFIPARIAPLFFFDGEKVEELADPNHTSEILQSAIHSLLGLDIVDQLQTDLEILERRKRKGTNGTQELSPAEQRERHLAAEVERRSSRVAERLQEKASMQNELERLQKQLRDQEEILTNQGGQLFEQRHELEKGRERAVAAIGELEEQLRDHAAGALPLALVQSMVHELEATSRHSHTASVQATILGLLEDRDRSILDRIRILRGSKGLLADMEAFLTKDRSNRSATTATLAEPSLDSTGLARAHALVGHVLPTEIARIRDLVRKLEDLETQVQIIERKLAGLPDEERILPMLEVRDRLRDAAVEKERALEICCELLKAETQECERAKSELDANRRELAETMLEGEDMGRLLRHSLRARETLQLFRGKVLATHVRMIEKLALECFTTLMRKQYLVRDLRIDPERFSVELQSEDGHVVPPTKLSAGERQLLAIALLWGLSRASGRPLPTVIDTPLGRLDSSHRRNLVERYFPHASHQVVLLSTDEEIDQRFQQSLESHISRSYLLEFNDRDQVTTVRDGYFW